MESEFSINNVNSNVYFMDRLCPKEIMEEMADEELLLEKIENGIENGSKIRSYDNDMEKNL